MCIRDRDELRRMGADILVDGKVAVIQGGKPLTAAPVKAVDCLLYTSRCV